MTGDNPMFKTPVKIGQPIDFQLINPMESNGITNLKIYPGNNGPMYHNNNNNNV